MERETNPTPTPAAAIAIARGDLDNAIVATTPGGIERQEKEGQSEFVASDTLPVACNLSDAELSALGFTLGWRVDNLFRQAKLPPGWTKVASDHAMWSHLRDERGRQRAAIFYKAAFYDRDANISFVRRYKPDYQSTNPAKRYDYSPDAPYTAFVTDAATGERVWESGATTYDGVLNADDGYGGARAWLDANRPGWMAPTAHWNEAS